MIKRGCMIFVVLLIILTGCQAPDTYRTQTPPGKFAIKEVSLAKNSVIEVQFVVKDLSGQPIMDAIIKTEDEKVSLKTDRMGQVSTQLPNGIYSFIVSKPNYKKMNVPIKSNNKNLQVEIHLSGQEG